MKSEARTLAEGEEGTFVSVPCSVPVLSLWLSSAVVGNNPSEDGL